MSATATTETHAEALAERLLGDTVVFAEYLSVSLGLELGLYAALTGAGPTTPRQLAQRADIAPRYAREWLEQQTVAGYLSCDNPAAPADDRAFSLPDATAAVLLEPASGVYIGPLADMARGIVAVLPQLRDAYRSGGGVPYHAYGEGIRHGIGALNGATFDAAMATWIAGLPDVHARLSGPEPSRILDIGCGIGRSSIALARAYPSAEVHGIDLDEASVTEATAAATAAGLGHRVRFAVGDAADTTQAGPYDLITIFEALHDMGDPVGALAAARVALAPGGTLYLVDEKVAPAFTPDADLIERLQYGFSVLHCLPATLAEDPVVAHGTVLREPTVRQWAASAGFRAVTDLDVDDLFWRHYRLDA